eukprot:6203513-Pleurochrysis_carterae.AAC.1
MVLGSPSRKLHLKELRNFGQGHAQQTKAELMIGYKLGVADELGRSSVTSDHANAASRARQCEMQTSSSQRAGIGRASLRFARRRFCKTVTRNVAACAG